MKYVFSILLLLYIFPRVGYSQFCTGSIGDNIFLDGDFGSGIPNVLSQDPNLAPDYIYNTTVPPADGSYVITNSTAAWEYLFATWLPITDNSVDQSGYMMVVNASSTPGIFYEQTISGLCGNTLYEFSADIINLIRVGVPDHIDPNVSFLINGAELFSTGDIPQTNEWNSFGFTFSTEINQEVLSLSLRNNAPGGVGNDLALDNISFRACGPITAVLPEPTTSTICEGDPPLELQASINGNQYTDPVLQWQESFDFGLTWSDIIGARDLTFIPSNNTSGTHFYRFILADGESNLTSEKCRVNSGIKIIAILPTSFNQEVTICEGRFFNVGNSVYTESGIFIDSLINTQGCDSILTTNLTVRPATNLMADLVIMPPCNGNEDGSITVENITGSTGPFSFTLDGEDFGETSFFTGLNGNQTYTIVIEDDIGCTLELTAMVPKNELELDLGQNETIELGDELKLIPLFNFTPSNYTWQAITFDDCIVANDCSQLDIFPTQSQQIKLDLLADNGCTVSDSIFIEVLPVRKAGFPSIFSPNRDGINDVFIVLGETPNIQMVESFRIYNRWGAILFEKEEFLPNLPQHGWNGTFDGRDVSPGTYVYKAVIRFLDDQVFLYSGDITIIK